MVQVEDRRKLSVFYHLTSVMKGEGKVIGRRLVSFLLMTCLMATFGCSLKTVDTFETGDKRAAKSKVLIVTQKSRFKTEVVSEIKKALGQNVLYTKVVDVKWLPNESLEDYSAIVILNRCMAGRPDPRVEIFIDNLQDKNKLVVLTTGRLDSWKPESPEVDAITSASTMSETTVVARIIADKIMGIISSQKKI